MKAIKQLADAVGLQERYTNAWGKPTVMTDQIREALLTAMGYAIDSEKDIEEAVHSMELSKWQQESKLRDFSRQT